MTLRQVVLPETETEILEAIRWYETHRDGLGLEFLAALQDAMARVTQAPRSWSVWVEEPRYRRMVMRRFPYVLFYELRADTIEFVACAHASRRPGYWRDRSGSGDPKD